MNEHLNKQFDVGRDRLRIIVWIAKAIERIGDHLTNMAENLIHIASGEGICHVPNLTAETGS